MATSTRALNLITPAVKYVHLRLPCQPRYHLTVGKTKQEVVV